MTKKKEPETRGNTAKATIPHRIRIFKSFEEQAAYELEQMAALTPEEILRQLRQFVNRAYGMHGYDPDKLPKKHFVKIISK